jgi:hypothetical protein
MSTIDAAHIVRQREFSLRVFGPGLRTEGVPDTLGQMGWIPDDDQGPEIDPQVSTDPCPECGALGACAWDSEGRPMIHTTTPEERES